MMKVLNIVGARPNFMKIAPIMEEMKKYPQIESVVVHTGQHYDDEMSNIFFKDLNLPKPDIYLGVGSGTHAEQTAKIMIEFEKVIVKETPDLILVVGDVNSTLACTLVGVKLNIPIAHVEAGLRSFDRTMPEEINRLVTDSLGTYLFTTCQDANENLKREGIPEEKIFFVGNVMIDTLLRYKEKAILSNSLNELNLKEKNFVLLTLHRPGNVDNEDSLINILDALDEIQQTIKMIYPIHPRTKKRIKEFNLEDKIQNMRNLILTAPIGYIDFLNLMIHSKFVMTDSGGLQEETTFLNIPCLTIRGNTERPITTEIGTNILVGTDTKKIVKESMNILNGNKKVGKIPPLWDGRASERIVRILLEENYES
ncbi:MAG: UDP-N-acetylglucosamine 2-epimerase (non-hydrolyzing) [bacterium]